VVRLVLRPADHGGAGFRDLPGAQIGLAVLAVAMAAISATTGVDKGIRLLSQLNVTLALGLAAYVLLTGRTSFILNAVVMNVGDYAQTFPGKTMETFAFQGATEWMSLWTLFFWAWWIAWASFVGLFLARISRGRTIRQFVTGTLIIPFTDILMWISIFGNAALDRIRGGDDAFADAALASPRRASTRCWRTTPFPAWSSPSRSSLAFSSTSPLPTRARW
jgi:choline/glycine/proline betaine transport protein